MIHRPPEISAFEFAVLAALRAAQLIRGCAPRVEGDHKFVVTAQLEVAAGRVVRVVEGTVQDLSGAIGATAAPGVLRSEEHSDGPTGVRTEAPSPLGSAKAGMMPTGRVSPGDVS